MKGPIGGSQNDKKCSKRYNPALILGQSLREKRAITRRCRRRKADVPFKRHLSSSSMPVTASADSKEWKLRRTCVFIGVDKDGQYSVFSRLSYLLYGVYQAI